MKRLSLVILLFLSGVSQDLLRAQEFVHPGIDQTKEDLDYMRRLVLEGEQPWKDAFDRLINSTDPGFKATPVEHVMRGPYGRPNIGGRELSKSAEVAYDCANILRRQSKS